MRYNVPVTRHGEKMVRGGSNLFLPTDERMCYQLPVTYIKLNPHPGTSSSRDMDVYISSTCGFMHIDY